MKVRRLPGNLYGASLWRAEDHVTLLTAPAALHVAVRQPQIGVWAWLLVYAILRTRAMP